ncbi:MAG: HhH-GPD family protein [Streptosporangiaceae bacterium]
MTTRFERPIADWFAVHARDLPWRAPDAGPWAIVVSEFMLQQTPVPRVLPAYQAWLERWPTPAALAAATPADAVRQWDRLGYPRRAIRLHAAATVIADRHGGTVPVSLADLRALPGVGDYTAAAVASFAFGQRHPVLDVNIRRVLTRLVTGRDLGGGSVSVAETALATALLPPARGGRAARWNAAVMELGALVCTAARPACQRCPVAAACAWLAGGRPPADRPRRGQAYLGSDRQCRGALLAVLRSAAGPVPVTAFDGCWPDAGQRVRVLAGLVGDGLVTLSDGGMASLPGEDAADPGSG